MRRAGPRVVVFAYHTLGARCLGALIKRGVSVAAVVTHEDDPDEPRWFESVAELARAHGLTVFVPRFTNTPEFVSRLRALEPELLVSVMYRRLLSSDILALPTLGAVNLHPSLLPKYRGRAPVNWVLVNGETRTGVTLHHMVEEADAGDIIAQDVVPIAPDDTALALYGKIEAAGAALFERMYPALAAGRAPRVPQDHRQATVFGRRRPEDGRISWAWPAARIANMIRAVTDPFPGASVGSGVACLRLWAGEAVGTVGAGPPPGTVVRVVPALGVEIATGEGLLRLLRVQTAAGPRERADLWAARCGVASGTRLEEGT